MDHLDGRRSREMLTYSHLWGVRIGEHLNFLLLSLYCVLAGILKVE
jgi:hypothetical protein